MSDLNQARGRHTNLYHLLEGKNQRSSCAEFPQKIGLLKTYLLDRLLTTPTSQVGKHLHLEAGELVVVAVEIYQPQ